MEEAKKDNLRLDDDTLENVSGGKDIFDLMNDKGDHEMGSSVVNFDCPVCDTTHKAQRYYPATYKYDGVIYNAELFRCKLSNVYIYKFIDCFGRTLYLDRCTKKIIKCV